VKILLRYIFITSVAHDYRAMN